MPFLFMVSVFVATISTQLCGVHAMFAEFSPAGIVKKRRVIDRKFDSSYEEARGHDVTIAVHDQGQLLDQGASSLSTRSSLSKPIQATGAKDMSLYDRMNHLGQAQAEATCTSLLALQTSKGTGWVFAVQRQCGSGKPTCDKVCGGLQGPKGKLKCFNSLHMYGNKPTAKTGSVGLKTYIYGKCGGGCGPNYCCCFGSYGKSSPDARAIQPRLTSLAQAAALTAKAQDITQRWDHRTPSWKRMNVLGQAQAQATCTALMAAHTTTATGWTFAVQRTCSKSGATCEQVCAGSKERQAGTLKCFNSLHLYSSSPWSSAGKLGLKTYIYGGCGGGCGPNYCCCGGGVKGVSNKAIQPRLNLFQENFQAEDVVSQTAQATSTKQKAACEDAAKLPGGHRCSASWIKKMCAKKVSTGGQNFLVSDCCPKTCGACPSRGTCPSQAGSAQSWNRYGAIGQVQAQATCTALMAMNTKTGTGWTFAVMRPCSSKGGTCESVCAGVTERQAKTLKCFNSLHIYSKGPWDGVAKLGLKTYIYGRCDKGGCGPNFCCCGGGVKGVDIRPIQSRMPTPTPAPTPAPTAASTPAPTKTTTTKPTFTLKNAPVTSPKNVVATLTTKTWPENYCVDFDVTFPPTQSSNKHGYEGAVVLMDSIWLGVVHTKKLFGGSKSNGMGLMAIIQSDGKGPYYATGVVGQAGSRHKATFCYNQRENKPSWIVDKVRVKAGYISHSRKSFPVSRTGSLSVLTGSHTNNHEALVGGTLHSMEIREFIEKEEKKTEEPKQKKDEVNAPTTKAPQKTQPEPKQKNDEGKTTTVQAPQKGQGTLASPTLAPAGPVESGYPAM